jgi:hypothetical protein
MCRGQQWRVNTLVWNVYEVFLHDFMFVKNFDGSKIIQRRQDHHVVTWSDGHVVQEYSPTVLDRTVICTFVSRVTTVMCLDFPYLINIIS